MEGHQVDARDDVYITLNSSSAEGVADNVKSDFVTTMDQPISLPPGTWCCLLDCITFSSKIVNYNGEYEESGREGGRGVRVEEGRVKRPAKRMKVDETTIVADYDVLAVDGEGKWRKVTPGDNGRTMSITFTDPTDNTTVANDINNALARVDEPVVYPPHPNPTTTTNDKGTYLQFYMDMSAYGADSPAYFHMGLPLQLEPVLNRCKGMTNFFNYIAVHGWLKGGILTSLGVQANGKLAFRVTDNKAGFTVYGNDVASRRRMMRVFGHDEDTVSIDTGISGEWYSPHVASTEKPEHGTPIDPYNLSAPYTWWGPSAVRKDDHLGDFLKANGQEFFHVIYKVGDRTMERHILYEDLLNCPTADAALELILLKSIDHQFDESGHLQLKNKRKRACEITITGMPCDVVPNLFGLVSYPPHGYWHANVEKQRVELNVDLTLLPESWSNMPRVSTFTPRKTAPLSSLVYAVAEDDPDRIVFRKKDGPVEHAHGFSMAFPEESPFYPFAKVTVGGKGGGTYIPPKGYPSSMVIPKDMQVLVKGADGVRPAIGRIDPSTIVPFEPFPLAGLIPHGPDQDLMLKEDWQRKMPESGYRATIAAKRVVPTEEWSGVWSRTQAYAFNDVVGDLPFPASYQTPAALIAALHTSMNHAIADDPDNAQHGCKAEELMKVIYDKSTCKYIFECGEKAASVHLSMRRKMAEIFGVLPDDCDDPFVTIAFASPHLYEITAATESDMDWARKGHAVIKHPWLKVGASPSDPPLPVAVSSIYPVTPSTGGTENMYIKCDLIDMSTIHDGKRDNVLATVPVNWTEEASSVHQPMQVQPIPIKTNIVRSIRMQAHDSEGNRIKFMSNDNTPVIYSLRLTRRKRA